MEIFSKIVNCLLFFVKKLYYKCSTRFWIGLYKVCWNSAIIHKLIYTKMEVVWNIAWKKHNGTYETKYSRVDQVKLVEDSLKKTIILEIF